MFYADADADNYVKNGTAMLRTKTKSASSLIIRCWTPRTQINFFDYCTQTV